MVIYCINFVEYCIWTYTTLLLFTFFFYRGTCAGMVLLSNHAVMQQAGGQALIGGLDAHVCRNYFGSQIHSYELTLQPQAHSHSQQAREGSNVSSDVLEEKGGGEARKGKYAALVPYNAVFIRAPAILKVFSLIMPFCASSC